MHAEGFRQAEAQEGAPAVSTRPLFDAVVVGGGPAGASAALALAKGGARTALLERERPPRRKVCGGGLTPRALRLLPAEAAGAVEVECRTAELRLPGGGLSFRVERKTPIVSVSERAHLDALLLEAARRAGVRLYAPCTAEDVRRIDGGYEVLSAAGRLGARSVLAADGVRSGLARRLGIGPPPLLAPALDWKLESPDPPLPGLRETARFEVLDRPPGYAWIFPKARGFNAGVAACGPRGRNAERLERALADFLVRAGLDPSHAARRDAWAVPLRPAPGGLARGGILLLGDAAGLVDPLTLEGISWALLSGRLAAECILEAGGDAACAGTLYEQRVEREILPELRIASRLAALLYSSPRLRTWIFRRRGRECVEAVTRVMEGRATYRGLLLSPGNILRVLRKRSEMPAVEVLPA